jgi:hypothetical protein
MVYIGVLVARERGSSCFFLRGNQGPIPLPFLSNILPGAGLYSYLDN